jgi:RAT1-interacting protein
MLKRKRSSEGEGSPPLESERENKSDEGAGSNRDAVLKIKSLNIRDITADYHRHTHRNKVPPFQRPVELMCFSYDRDRKQHMDDRALTYYYPPDLSRPEQCSLSAGYPQLFRKRPEFLEEHLDALVNCLEHLRPQLEDYPSSSADAYSAGKNDGHNDNPTVVTWRGIMTKVLCTPYAQNEPWQFACCRRNGVLFIEEPLEFRRQRTLLRPPTDRDNLMTYWGYRFEALCTVDCHPKLIEDPSNDPRVCERHKSVVDTHIQCMAFENNSYMNQ